METTGNNTPKESYFKISLAQPDDPIFSQGWTVGSLLVSKLCSIDTAEQNKDSQEKPKDKESK